MLISIVIVSWNGREDIGHCLLSLRAQTDQEFEIIIVDNNSSDGTTDFIRETFPEVNLYEERENLGFAEGCNRGIDHASGSWVATLNQDTKVDPDWLAELKTQAQSCAEEVGMLQSRMLFMDKPNLVNSTGIELTSNAEGSDREFMLPVRGGIQVEEIFCPTAGAALYRREMLDEVRLETGYFDKTFFMYWEDIDLGWRCRLAGWSALYVPTATVYHQFQGSAKLVGKTFVEVQCYKNRLRSLLKNGSAKLLINLLKESCFDLHIRSKLKRYGGINNLLFAMRDGFRQRKCVKRIVKNDRLELERKWIPK